MASHSVNHEENSAQGLGNELLITLEAEQQKILGSVQDQFILTSNGMVYQLGEDVQRHISGTFGCPEGAMDLRTEQSGTFVGQVENLQVGENDLFNAQQLHSFQTQEEQIPVPQLPNLGSVSPTARPVQRRAPKKRKFTSYNDDRPWVTEETDRDSGKPLNIVAAAQSLFAKRTRTLFRFLYPDFSKNEVKAEIEKSWRELPPAEREIYFAQAMGRYNLQPRPLMVNPLISRLLNRQDDETSAAVQNLLRAEGRLDLHGMEEIGQQSEMSMPLQAPVPRVEVPARRGRGRRRNTYKTAVLENGNSSNDVENLGRLRAQNIEALAEKKRNRRRKVSATIVSGEDENIYQ